MLLQKHWNKERIAQKQALGLLLRIPGCLADTLPAFPIVTFINELDLLFHYLDFVAFLSGWHLAFPSKYLVLQPPSYYNQGKFEDLAVSHSCLCKSRADWINIRLVTLIFSFVFER